MATCRAAIAAVLRDDPEVAVLLPGGVWERPLINEAGVTEAEGATPGAFDIQTGRLKPCAVVSLSGVGQSLAGNSLVFQFGGRPPIGYRAATINLYQPRPWRDAIEGALLRVQDLLDEVQLQTDDLGTIVVRFTGNIGDNPGDDDLNAELERANLSVSSMRRRL